MSSSSSYGYVDSDDDNNSWLVSSENSMEDDDELTLLNGDEENYENSSSFEDFLRLSIRLKKQYNLQEASVALERCDKIWDTMQLLKRAQESYAEQEESDDTDDENEQEDWVKSSHRTSDSVSSSVNTGAITYIKYEPTQGNGNNALPNFYLSVKKQTKIYNCAICGKIYSEKRAFRLHVKRDHEIVAVTDEARNPKHSNNSETRLARPKTPQTDTSSVDGDRASQPQSLKTRLSGVVRYQCPVCENLYTYERRLRTHAKATHGFEIPENYKIKEIAVKTKKKGRQKTEHEKISYVYTPVRTNNENGYLYFCIACHKDFCAKRALRSHLMQSHEIQLAKGPEGILNGLFIRDIESLRQYLRALQQIRDAEASPSKSGRAGPLSSKTYDRPKRACTVNASYTETTKEEEEILEYNEPASYTNKKPASSGPLSKCFLCQQSCADMPLHLKDYHRISKPDSVLPFNEQLSADPTGRENYNKAIKSEAKGKSRSVKDIKDWDLLDKQMKGLYKKLSNSPNGGKQVQCLLCKSTFSKLWGLKLHLATKMKNGVVQMHEPATRGRIRAKALLKKKYEEEKATQDPLELGAKSIVDGASGSTTKRRQRYSDSSSSTSEVMPFKRRKFEMALESNDKSSDCGSEESEEEEEEKEDEAMRKSEKNARYDRVDGTVTEDSGTDKSPDQRDTRESSDRDSGIGISITIKKRNNSYEVVERDNCEADKVKDHEDQEVSKDENVIPLDSSSDTTTDSNYRNGHELAGDFRTRQLFDPLDCSGEPSIDDETRVRDDDDITIVGSTLSTLSRTTEQINKQNVRFSHKTSTEIPGSSQRRET